MKRLLLSSVHAEFLLTRGTGAEVKIHIKSSAVTKLALTEISNTAASISSYVVGASVCLF